MTRMLYRSMHRLEIHFKKSYNKDPDSKETRTNEILLEGIYKLIVHG